MSTIVKYFKINQRDSSVGQEIRAGISTFLTMSYILLVNPQIISKLGIPATDVVISTALSSAIGCFIAGVFGNLPFGLAPGMGLSAYLVYGLVFGDGLSTKEAFTSCFIAGIILTLFSVLGLSQLIMRVIPRSVKLSTIVGMGLQIAMVGMTSVQLVIPNEQTIVGLGSLDNYKIWYSFMGLILIGTLLYHEIRGAILISIIVLTILTWKTENSYPSKIFEFPQLKNSISDYLSFSDFDIVKCFGGIVAFVFIGIIDVSGIIYGMSILANLNDSDGNIPGSLYGFLGSSVGTLISAITGGTPIIVYVESAAGIKEGGRTGLTAVVIGICFLLSLVLSPLFAQIPVTATSPVAIFVGALMMSPATEIDWNNMSEAIPAFLTLTIMPLTFSITNGILFGLLAAFSFYITTGQAYTDFKNRRNNRYINIATRNESESFDSNILDYKPLVRTPSLLLNKKDSDTLQYSGQGLVTNIQENSLYTDSNFQI